MSLVTFAKSRSLIFIPLVTLPATNTPVHSSTGATFWSSVLRWEIHRASKNCNVEKTDIFLDLFDIIGLTYAQIITHLNFELNNYMTQLREMF